VGALGHLDARAAPARQGAGTRIGLTAQGRRLAQRAILDHGGNVRRYFLDALTPEQATAMRAWSEQSIDHIEPAVPIVVS
jgi:phage baseplate assembly protein W